MVDRLRPANFYEYVKWLGEVRTILEDMHKYAQVLHAEEKLALSKDTMTKRDLDAMFVQLHNQLDRIIQEIKKGRL